MLRIIFAFSTFAVAFSYELFFNENKSTQKHMWEQFKAQFNRIYLTEDEETLRFGIFLDNLKIVDQRNTGELLIGGSAVHGITRFSDITQLEFEEKFLSAYKVLETGGTVKAEVAPYAGEESLVDWTGLYTTPIKDQGDCGEKFILN